MSFSARRENCLGLPRCPPALSSVVLLKTSSSDLQRSADLRACSADLPINIFGILILTLR